MRDDRESSSGAGVVIAAVAVVLVLLMCGGGALAVAGLFFFRMSARHVVMPPMPTSQPAPAAAHVDVLAVEADGSLLWNDAPIERGELRQRLTELANAAGPPRSVILRSDAAAPPGSQEEVVQILNDRGISFIVEEER